MITELSVVVEHGSDGVPAEAHIHDSRCTTVLPSERRLGMTIRTVSGLSIDPDGGSEALFAAAEPIFEGVGGFGMDIHWCVCEYADNRAGHLPA